MGSSKPYMLIPNRVIFIKNAGELTTDILRRCDAELTSLMRKAYENSSNTVNVVVDFTDMAKLPNLTELEGGRILKYFQEPNCGWSMVVGYRNNPFLTIVARLLTSVMGGKLYMADTLSDAENQIKRLCPDIADRVPDIEKWKSEQI